MIQHNTVKDLLGLTMLVYDYSKKFTLNEDETIESFVNKNENTKNDDINLEITQDNIIESILETGINIIKIIIILILFIISIIIDIYIIILLLSIL